MPVLVTNRHVVEGYDDAKIFLTKADEGKILHGTIIEVNIHELQRAVVYHPDPDIDLAVISIGHLLHELNESGHYQRVGWISSNVILKPWEEDEIDYVETVYVYGYPEGLWDEIYNLPVVREGITATPAFHRFRDKSVFLIDCAIFPGSSGSPVVISRKMKETGEGYFRLVGINAAVFQSCVDGLFEMKPIPRDYEMKVDVRIPNNLGVVVMAFELFPIFEVLAKQMGLTYEP